MLGAYVAGRYVEVNWGLSFIVPGFIIGLYGFILFLFIVPCKCALAFSERFSVRDFHIVTE